MTKFIIVNDVTINAKRAINIGSIHRINALGDPKTGQRSSIVCEGSATSVASAVFFIEETLNEVLGLINPPEPLPPMEFGDETEPEPKPIIP